MCARFNDTDDARRRGPGPAEARARADEHAGNDADGAAPGDGLSGDGVPDDAAGAPDRDPLTDREFPCRQCGAKLVFKPGTTTLTCRYCGAANEIAGGDDQGALSEALQELDYARHLDEMEGQEEHQDKIVVHCDSCGADVDMQPNVTSQACPFCGTPIVATGRTRKLLRPRALVPFQIDDRRSREMFDAWLRGRWFAPNDLKRSARVEGRLAGYYLPFWTFDAQADTPYRGQRGDDHYVGSGKNRRRVTRWRSVSGRVRNAFNDVLVLASAGVPGDLVGKLGDWNLGRLVPYADEYLSGFKAESYTVDLKGGFERARAAMENEIRATIRRDIGGDHQRIEWMQPRYSDVTFKHILLPIYIAAYRYKDRTYRFLVNAQTGTVSGQRPWSWVKITLAVLGGLLLLGVLWLLTRDGVTIQL